MPCGHGAKDTKPRTAKKSGQTQNVCPDFLQLQTAVCEVFELFSSHPDLLTNQNVTANIFSGKNRK